MTRRADGGRMTESDMASRSRLEARGRAFRVTATLTRKNDSRAIAGHKANRWTNGFLHLDQSEILRGMGRRALGIVSGRI